MPEARRGVLKRSFRTWRSFVTQVLSVYVDEPDFVWRGQRLGKWPLAPSLDRVLRERGVKASEDAWRTAEFEHLNRFKLASRGRGGIDARALEERELPNDGTDSRSPGDAEGDEAEEVNGLPRPSAADREENNWWAVGQHYGLYTPLLDWTSSPFVAAFFAYETEHPYEEETGEPRVIYGLHRRMAENRSKELMEEGRMDRAMQFIEPLYKGNPRLVSQGGLFTRAPRGMNVKDWVQKFCDSTSKNEAWLLEFRLPDAERDKALRTLNRMNINEQSLFPDLHGAAAYVNFHLQVDHY